MLTGIKKNVWIPEVSWSTVSFISWMSSPASHYPLSSLQLFLFPFCFLLLLYLQGGQNISYLWWLSWYGPLVLNQITSNCLRKAEWTPVSDAVSQKNNLRKYLLNFKRKIWTWTRTQTRASRSLAWRSIIELSWFFCQLISKLSSWNNCHYLQGNVILDTTYHLLITKRTNFNFE